MNSGSVDVGGLGQGFIPAFTQFPEIRAGFTTRWGDRTSPPLSSPPTSPFSERNLGFFSGDEESKVALNWQQTLEALGFGLKTLVLPRMNHGTESIEIKSPSLLTETQPYDFRSGLKILAPRDRDAVYTRSAEYVLAVTMADCMPILVYDPTTQCRAAIHSGWRGTRDGILRQTLDKLFQQGHAKPGTTWLCMGPAIGAKRLELGPEVMVTVDKRFAVAWEANGQIKHGMDMLAWNVQQALDLGVAAVQIETVGRCTYDEPDFFFSYRRDGARSGRMAALIGSLEASEAKR